jgi:hypothetical protein
MDYYISMRTPPKTVVDILSLAGADHSSWRGLPGTTALPRIAVFPHNSKFRLRSDGGPRLGIFIIGLDNNTTSFTSPSSVLHAWAKGFDTSTIKIIGTAPSSCDLSPSLADCMDMNVGTWLTVAARDMPRLPTDVATVFIAPGDTPLQLQVQIVDEGASRFINANRHEFHTYIELPPANRYKLSEVLATVHGYGTTMEVYTALDGRQVRSTLNDVLHAPDFVQYAPHGISKLFSQGRAQDAGATSTYTDKCYMTLSTRAEIPIRRIPECGLYGSMPEPIMPTPLLRSLPSVVILVGLLASQLSYGIAVSATSIMMAFATLSRDPPAYLVLSTRQISVPRARSPSPPWRPVVVTLDHGIKLPFIPSTWTHGGLLRHHYMAIIRSSELSAGGLPSPWVNPSSQRAKCYTSSRSC